MSFEDSLFILCLVVLSVLGKVSVRTCDFQSFGNFLTFIDLEVIEFGEKLSADEKSKIEAAKEALKEALKGEDTDAIKAKQEELQKELFAVSEKVYKTANPQGADNAASQGEAQNGGNDSNVYEADYTDVEDGDKK